MKPINKRSEEAVTWWPHDLGDPSVYGSSNGLRYAYFAADHRLAVAAGQGVKLYDTGEKFITGFSVSDGETLTLHTDDGPTKLIALKLLGEP